MSGAFSRLGQGNPRVHHGISGFFHGHGEIFNLFVLKSNKNNILSPYPSGSRGLGPLGIAPYMMALI
jgi:hypothetical protein